MDKIMQEKLFKRFGFLHKKDMPKGIECENGWYDIIEEMLIEMRSTNLDDEFKITKIYSRGDHIDVYTVNGNCGTRLCIADAIDQSYDICEYCGNDIDLEMCEYCK